MDLQHWIYNFKPIDEKWHSDVHAVNTVCVLATVFTILVVALRVHVRVHMLSIFAAGDWIICASALSSVIYNVLVIEQTRLGLGLPLAARPALDKITYTKVNYAARPFYMFAVMGFKISLLLSYLRMVGTRTYFKTVIWCTIGLCVITHIVGSLVLIFICAPVRKSWSPNTPGHCLPSAEIFYILAANSIIFDILVILMPIPLLWKTFIDRRKKIFLGVLFALFLFTTICSLLRMGQIRVIVATGNSTGLVLWGVAEAAVGIVTTCIPPLSPLLKVMYESARDTVMEATGSSFRSRGESRSKKSMHRSTILQTLSAQNRTDIDAGSPFARIRDGPSTDGRRGTSTHISSPTANTEARRGFNPDIIKVDCEVQVEVESQNPQAAHGIAGSYPWN